MERGYNSPQHHAAGQWRDTNRTLSPDSWVLLCLLFMLSSIVPSISIDFKLTPTFLIMEGKNSQEGSLCSALLESYRMVWANTFCKGLCCKAVQAGLTLSTILKGVPDAHKMPQTSYRGFRKMQNTVITWLKLRKEGFWWMQLLLLTYITTCLPPYHLFFFFMPGLESQPWVTKPHSVVWFNACPLFFPLPRCPKFSFTGAANFCKHKAATGFPCLLELESQENTLYVSPP